MILSGVLGEFTLRFYGCFHFRLHFAYESTVYHDSSAVFAYNHFLVHLDLEPDAEAGYG